MLSAAPAAPLDAYDALPTIEDQQQYHDCHQGPQDTSLAPGTCELAWLPDGEAEQCCIRAATDVGYRPWCESSDRPLLDPPQDPAVANAKYVFAVTKALGKQPSASELEAMPAEERANAAAVRAGLSYPDPSGDTAIWMVMATRPIRQHEEILVEKYQQLESGVSNDGSGIRASPPQAQTRAHFQGEENSNEAVPASRKVKRPRSTKRSAGVQQIDAAQKWARLRPSLDHCQPASVEGCCVTSQDEQQRYVIPPPLRVTTRPTAHAAAFASEEAARDGGGGGGDYNGPRQHRQWGGMFDYSAYAANQHPAPTDVADADADGESDGIAELAPFRKAGGDGSRLSRAEGVAAVRNSCVLGKGVYISPSVVSGAGNGLFCDLSQGLDRGDVITVYDGILESVGGLVYDPVQRAFFNPKLASEHTSPDNPLWRFGGSPTRGAAAAAASISGDGGAAGSDGAGGGVAAAAAVGAGAVGGSKGFQSHWKDAGAAPGGTSVIMGFGGYPVPFAPCGLGAGAMVNAVYGCKGRVGRDPEALAQRRAERARREELGVVEKKRPVGSKLACSLGWGNMGRKRRRKKKKPATEQPPAGAHVAGQAPGPGGGTAGA